MTAPTIEHLLTLPHARCGQCRHMALAHYRQPSCGAQGCHCSLDPKCPRCGELTSKHEIPEALP